jgi:hypothetical protein
MLPDEGADVSRLDPRDFMLSVIVAQTEAFRLWLKRPGVGSRARGQDQGLGAGGWRGAR